MSHPRIPAARAGQAGLTGPASLTRLIGALGWMIVGHLPNRPMNLSRALRSPQLTGRPSGWIRIKAVQHGRAARGLLPAGQDALRGQIAPDGRQYYMQTAAALSNFLSAALLRPNAMPLA